MGYGFKMGGRGVILKPPKLEPSVQTLSVTGAELTKTFTIDWKGDGTPEVASSNTDVATVSLSGNVVTVTFVSQGTANVTITIKQTKHYLSDEAIIPITCTRSDPTLTLSNTTLSISGASGSGTLTVTYDGDGTLSVSSSATEVATASISAKTVTVAYKTQGSTTVTVSAAQTVYYNAASATCAVTTTRSNPSFVLNQATLGIAGATGSASITVKTNQSGGSISAVSSATGVATVSKTNNTTIKVTYINAGSSTVTVTVAQTDFYNAASAKCTVTCTRSGRSLSISRTSASLSAVSTPSATFTFTFSGDSQLDYSSNNTNVATIGVNKRSTGGTGTIYWRGGGSCTITVSVPQTNKYNYESKTISVSCTTQNVTAIGATPTYIDIVQNSSKPKYFYFKYNGDATLVISSDSQHYKAGTIITKLSSPTADGYTHRISTYGSSTPMTEVFRAYAAATNNWSAGYSEWCTIHTHSN